MNKAIFLDKDGTLVPDVPYNIEPGKIILSDDSVEGLQLLARDGFQLIVVSNQSGIARGYFTEDQFAAVITRLDELLSEQGIKVTGFYYCPHHRDGTVTDYAIDCDCRKPLPGMLLQAAKDHQIDLGQSWMIGDILNDVEAGNRAGCRSVLIDNGNETEWVESPYRSPDHRCININQAADFIHQTVLAHV